MIRHSAENPNFHNLAPDEMPGAMQNAEKQPDLAEALKALGWTQKRLAEYLGLTQNQMSDWMRGRNLPKEFSEEMERRLLLLTKKLPEDLFPDEQPKINEVPIGDSSLIAEMDRRSFFEYFNKGGLTDPTRPDNKFYNSEFAKAIDQAISTLTPREEEVLRMRFGLDGGSEHRLDEVAKHFDLTRERIRQIEARALRKLRHPSRSRPLKAFLEKK